MEDEGLIGVHRRLVPSFHQPAYFTPAEVQAALERPVVKGLFELIRFRNQHPAFDGEFQIEPSESSRILFRWTNGDAWAKLDVNLETMSANNTCTQDGGTTCRSVTDPQGPAK
jgi:hypothetical protein